MQNDRKNKAQAYILLKHKDVLWKPKSETKIEQFKFSSGSRLQAAIDGVRLGKYGCGLL